MVDKEEAACVEEPIVDGASARAWLKKRSLLGPGVDEDVVRASAAEVSSALREASQNGRSEVAGLLMKVSSMEVDVAGALALAAKNGHKEVAAALLAEADPWLDGSQALIEAASAGRADIVELALPWSDTGAKNANGDTAVDLARRGGFEEAARAIEAYALARRKGSQLVVAKEPKAGNIQEVETKKSQKRGRGI